LPEWVMTDNTTKCDRSLKSMAIISKMSINKLVSVSIAVTINVKKKEKSSKLVRLKHLKPNNNESESK
jgi:hypothetical protein